MREGNEIIYEVTLYVRNIEYLGKVFLELEKLSYVTKVERLVRWGFWFKEVKKLVV